VIVDLPRMAAIVQRIAADVDELARARRVADLSTAAALPDRRAERRRRVAEPDLDFREFCHRSKLPQSALEQQRNGEWRYLEFLQVRSLITAEIRLREIPGGTRARQRSRPVDLPEHRY